MYLQLIISRLKRLSHIEATLETAFVCCGLFPSHFFSPLFEFLGNLCVQVWMVVHEGAKASEGMHGYTQVCTCWRVWVCAGVGMYGYVQIFEDVLGAWLGVCGCAQVNVGLLRCAWVSMGVRRIIRL